MQTSNLPLYYKPSLDKNEPIFIYNDKVEYVKLSRSDIKKTNAKIKQTNCDNKQIIVETHSEHIINQIILENTRSKNDLYSIYFFSSVFSSCSLI